ncbi:MAG TPA: hypothetical protein VJI98_02970 [Candidatus Nanoarchaeia archaeon]|nr:hypothetical protein [Candidatus Nanoarchaeia archaeon]
MNDEIYSKERVTALNLIEARRLIPFLFLDLFFPGDELAFLVAQTQEEYDATLLSVIGSGTGYFTGIVIQTENSNSNHRIYGDVSGPVAHFSIIYNRLSRPDPLVLEGFGISQDLGTYDIGRWNARDLHGVSCPKQNARNFTKFGGELKMEIVNKTIANFLKF